MKCFSWHLDTAGLFAAGVADVAFAAAAITDRDLRVDRADAGRAAHRAGAHAGLGRSRARRCSRRSKPPRARRRPRARAVAEVTLPPILEEAYRAHGIIQDYEACRALAFEYDRHRDQLGPILRAQLERGAAISADAYDARAPHRDARAQGARRHDGRPST